MYQNPQQYPVVGLPDLSHPMNLHYPYPVPPQPAFPPGYQPQPTPDMSQMQRPQPPVPGVPPVDRRPIHPQIPNRIIDIGPQPYVVDIAEATKENRNFRTVLWTGEHLQVTLMSIAPQEDIGLEIHRNNDQFLRIEEGQGVVLVGDSRQNLSMQSRIKEDDAVMIPAGKWHNVINTGHRPLKLYTIYAPAHHTRNTVHVTKQDAQQEHGPR